MLFCVLASSPTWDFKPSPRGGQVYRSPLSSHSRLSRCLPTVWESQGPVSGPVRVATPEVERVIDRQQLFDIPIIKLNELRVRYAVRWDQSTNLGGLNADHSHRIRSGVTLLEITLTWSTFAQRLTKTVKGDTPFSSATLFTISL
jgi:hypothetical protein